MVLVDSGPAWVVALAAAANVYLTHRNGRKSAERGKDTEKKLEALHKSTNGLSERNEAIARKLGVEEGTAAGLKEGREEGKT
jgi:hypothetical protein